MASGEFRVLALIPASACADNVVRDVLYGCWCKGKRIGGGTVPPLSALTIATILKEDGIPVDLIDALEQKIPLDELSETIGRYAVVLVLSSSMTLDEDAQAVAHLKHANPRLISVFYGSHPSFMPDACLRNESIDIVVRMEPDLIIRDLVRALRAADEGWRQIRGIGYRADGRVVLNELYPFAKDMSGIPIADRTLLPPGAHYFNPIVKRLPYTTSCTSRGCPGECTFCTAPAFSGKKIRAWPVETVLEEIAYLLSLGYREIYYRDETFTFNRERVEEICEGILRHGYDLTWICNVRVGTADEALLRLMKKAGCHLIKVGVESGSQQILDASRKHVRVEETRLLFRRARAVGLDTHAHLMFGMPGEAEETLRKTIAFLLDIDPTTMDIGICLPYPGSELHADLVRTHPDLADENRLSLRDLHTSGVYNELYTSVSRELLERYVVRAYRAFYFRPAYIIRWLRRVRSLGELMKVSRSGVNVISFGLFGDSRGKS